MLHTDKFKYSNSNIQIQICKLKFFRSTLLGVIRLRMITRTHNKPYGFHFELTNSHSTNDRQHTVLACREVLSAHGVQHVHTMHTVKIYVQYVNTHVLHVHACTKRTAGNKGK